MRARPDFVGVRPSRAAGMLLLLPAALLLAFAFYLPVGSVLIEGFQATSEAKGLSLDRAVSLIQDPYVQRLIGATVRQAALSALLSAAIGLPLAAILTHRSFFGKTFISSLMMVPFVMPTVTAALGFLLMFGVNGWLNQGLHALFGVKIRVLHSLSAIVLAHAFYNAPLVARMTQAAWERLDPSLEESARTLGAGPLAVWKDVTLPAIAPGVLSGGLLAFIYSFMSFPIVLTLGGARFSTLEVEIFTQIRVLLDYETGAALAAIQAAFSMLFAYGFLRVEGRRSPTFVSGGSRRVAPLFRRRWGDWWIVPFIVAAALLFIGPIISVVVHSFVGPDGGYTWAAYAQIFSARHDFHLGGPPIRSTWNSIRFALTGAGVALAAGGPFVFASVRIFGRRQPFLETVALAPIVVSSVALAFGVLIAFRSGPLQFVPDGWRIPLVHGVLAFPFVLRAFRPVLEQVDGRLIEAARTLGSRRWRAFVDIELPATATGLVVAFALAFGLSMSEMTTAMMLARPDEVTMPVSVYRFLAARDFHAASAMAVLLMTVTAGVFLLSELAAARVRGKLATRTESDGAIHHPF